MQEDKVRKFWENVTELKLDIEQVEKLCPGCAEKMREAGIGAVLLTEKKMPEQLKEGLCEKFMPEEGFFTRCTESGLGDMEPDDQEGFCAWLHHECLGKWPAEKPAEKGKRDKDSEGSYEQLLRRVRDGLWAVMGPELGIIDAYPDLELIWTFENTAIVRDYGTGKLYELDYEEDDAGKITFSNARQVKELYVQKKLLGENPGLSVKALYELMDEKDVEAYHRAVKGREDVQNPDALYSWIQYKINGTFPGYRLGTSETPTTTSKSGSQLELAGPFVWKDDEKQIAFAPVLVPGEKDHDGEAVTKKQVEDAAHEWMMHYRNVDIDHSMNNVGVPAESWVTQEAKDYEAVMTGEKMHLPKGTWMMGSWFPDKVWAGIKSGDYGGYSIMAVPRSAFLGTGALKTDVALKKVLLQDLGPDWVTTFVSLVKNPAVPKSKWVALKSAGDEPVQTEEKGFLGKLKGMVFGGSEEKSGRTISEENIESLKSALEGLAVAREELNRLAVQAGENKEASIVLQKSKEGNKMAEVTKEQFEELLATFKEENIDPLTADITALKELLAAKDEGDEKEGGEEQEQEQEQTPDPELEALKADMEEIRGVMVAMGEKLGVSTPKSIKGQDEEEPPEAEKELDFGERDALGLKVRK